MGKAAANEALVIGAAIARERSGRLEEPWGLTRAMICERDDWRCQSCTCRTNLTVHHIVPRSRGGRSWPENLVTLCIPCHDRIQSTWAASALPLMPQAAARSWRTYGWTPEGFSRFLALTRAITAGGAARSFDRADERGTAAARTLVAGVQEPAAGRDHRQDNAGNGALRRGRPGLGLLGPAAHQRTDS